MEKEFIPYEQALALKELGFDEPCFGWFRTTLLPSNFTEYFLETELGLNEEVTDLINSNFTGDACSAPLYQQAFRWFREKYKLQAEILWRGDMECFCYKTGKFKYGSHDFSKDDYSTYEKAEQACLIKLIEILKTK